jgi:PKD repeat protein
MKRARWGAVIGLVVASLVLATAASATPEEPSISVQQLAPLTMGLGSSTGTSWSWTIVDAANTVVATSSANPATVTLPAAGDYRALLDATDDDPVLTAPAHAEAPFHVYAQPAVGFDEVMLGGGSVQFHDTSTGEPTSWTWTFPGGTFSGQVPPTQTLPVGPSTVSLEVTNPAGSSTISQTVVVNGPPVVDLNVLSSPTAIDSPVLLDASRSTDPNQDPLSYSWDLDGDGHYDDATGELQTVTYAKSGRYRVGVQVSDGHGATSTAQATITVLVDQAPTVSFTNDPVQPAIGATVNFTATATDTDGTVDHVDWDLDDDGDFDDAAGLQASWSFDVAGRHRIAVRATDDRGVATVAFRSIVVVSPVLPTTPRTEPLPVPAVPSPTAPVLATAAPSVPAPSATRVPLLAPFPVVRISGLLYRGSVRISLLRVQAPPGATIRVRCHGGSCAAKRSDVRVKAARTPLRVRSFERRPLRAGTTIEVFVTAPGQIGKYTRFTVRKGAAPARSDLCLVPGHKKPTTCPTA